MRASAIASSLALASLLVGGFLTALPPLLRQVRPAHAEDPQASPRSSPPSPLSPPCSPPEGAASRPGSPRAVPGFPLLEARTPADLRIVLRYCEEADGSCVIALREAAAASPDPLVAGNAVRALGRLRAIGATDAAALLEDPRPRVRQEAVIALGAAGDPAAVDVLAGVLERPDASLHPLAVRALGRLGGTRARELIEARLREAATTETERVFAAGALRDLARPETSLEGPRAP